MEKFTAPNAYEILNDNRYETMYKEILTNQHEQHKQRQTDGFPWFADWLCEWTQEADEGKNKVFEEMKVSLENSALVFATQYDENEFSIAKAMEFFLTTINNQPFPDPISALGGSDVETPLKKEIVVPDIEPSPNTLLQSITLDRNTKCDETLLSIKTPVNDKNKARHLKQSRILQLVQQNPLSKSQISSSSIKDVQHTSKTTKDGLFTDRSYNPSTQQATPINDRTDKSSKNLMSNPHKTPTGKSTKEFKGFSTNDKSSELANKQAKASNTTSKKGESVKAQTYAKLAKSPKNSVAHKK